MDAWAVIQEPYHVVAVASTEEIANAIAEDHETEDKPCILLKVRLFLSIQAYEASK